MYKPSQAADNAKRLGTYPEIVKPKVEEAFKPEEPGTQPDLKPIPSKK